MKKFAHIIGTGSYAPENVLTNFDLEKMVDTSNEWITARTGIKRRHIAAKNVAASDLGTEAAKKAIAKAGIIAKDIDLILLATVTPDMPLPSTACIVQDNLDAVNAGAIDIVAACAGFIYGIALAKAMIITSQCDNVLVVAVETLSKMTNWKDCNTCVLFGDGAGAAVVQSSEKPGGIIATFLKSNGALANLLTVPAGGGRIPLDPVNIHNGDRYINMVGPEVYKNAVRAMKEAGQQVLKRTGLTSSDIKLLIPHQANIRIIDSTARKLAIPSERVFINIHEYGNTSAASIPIALDEAINNGRIMQSDKILMVAFGAGFTWGSAIVEF